MVVAIDFIAGDREVRAQKEFASVASLLKRYLEHPCVLRKPSDSQWPNRKALAHMSRADQVRWGAMQQQAQIDSLLSRVLNGESPQRIFKLGRGSRGNPGHGGRGWNSKRDTWMLCEVLWLMDREHVSRSEAESLVATEYDAAYPIHAAKGDSLKVVQRATARWFASGADGKDARAALLSYYTSTRALAQKSRQKSRTFVS